MEPKLLTEAEARVLLNGLNDHEKSMQFLRERGLIAPEPVEPVDPLHLEALELAAQSFELQGDAVTAREIRLGVYDNEADDLTTLPGLALAALKRGMELAQPTLTVGMVNEAVRPNVEHYGGGSIDYEGIRAALHAALTKDTDNA